MMAVVNNSYHFKNSTAGLKGFVKYCSHINVTRGLSLSPFDYHIRKSLKPGHSFLLTTYFN